MLKVYCKLSLLLLFLQPFTSRCQSFIFNDNDRISFIGSSISMNGACYHFVNMFYATRYPEKKLHFFNAGISGEVTDQILQRIDSDILKNKPDWCVMMIEENDLRPALYRVENQYDTSIQKQRSEAFHHWMTNTERIAETLMKRNVRIILETPTIYDQTMQSPAVNAYGINDTLQKCTEYIKWLGKKYNLPVVDCWTVLNRINRQVQRIDPKATIVGPDRTHVGEQGHFAVACTFLEKQKVQPFVSRLTIDFKTSRAINAENCSVHNMHKSGNSLSFQYLSRSLPFAAPPAVNTDSFTNFTDRLNAERISIRYLPAAKYILLIDSVEIGLFTHAQLQQGINLSRYKNTPQFRQSLNVMNLFETYWKNERLLRSLKYVEYQHHHDLEGVENLEQLQEKLPSIMEKYKISSPENYDFFYGMFKNYIANKPHEEEFYQKAEDLLQQIYMASKPEKHFYTIKRAGDLL